MLIKFKVKNVENDFIHLQNKDNEELKIKKEKLPENIKIDDEVNIKIFKKEDQENLSKEILNEILNTSENK